MADATLYTLTDKTWTQVTTSSTLAKIYNKDPKYTYYQTTRATGGPAPTAISGGSVPAEAIEMFLKGSVEIIPSSDGIDVYVCSFSEDGNDTTGGKVRVDY